MTFVGWIQVLVFFALILAATKPVGAYMYRVCEGGDAPLGRGLGRIENAFYRLFGVDPRQEQDWKGYTFALLAFSTFGVIVTYAIARLQGHLPFNPQHFAGVTHDLAFNTAASFTTNTDWQAYSGESTMSYLTQMAGLAWHNFTSAAAGICVALAVARGFTRRRPGSVWPWRSRAASPGAGGRATASNWGTSGSTSTAGSSTCSCRSASSSRWCWSRRG